MTAQQRYSFLNMGLSPVLPLFIPDGTVDSTARLHLLHLYDFGGAPQVSGIQEKYIGFIANCGQFLTRR